MIAGDIFPQRLKLIWENMWCRSPRPDLPTILLWMLGASAATQDFCSSPGDLPAPELILNVISAQEGELVLAHCSMGGEFPATQIIFCKDGMEVYSLKAVRGQLSYSVPLKASQESTGRYTCGYQHKDGSNRVRSSSLSAPRDLAIAGTATTPSTSPQEKPSPGAPTTGIALGVVAASLLLLLPPATYFTVKKYVNTDELGRVKVDRSSCEEESLYANRGKVRDDSARF
ncbi:uncharacterized protein LOC135324105 isoform X2 [Dromaius novaehollandiae]|uniref:uncharacterized protein LOC135324105 isoform X2 n=1 Tax=Dromaius novaehollandiae TaxID=8790 RepID=UPI00311EC6D5